MCQVLCAVSFNSHNNSMACNIIPIFSGELTKPKNPKVAKSNLESRLSEAKDHVLDLYSEKKNVLK